MRGSSAYSPSVAVREERDKLRAKLHAYIQKHCLLTGGDFTLSAGSPSSYYFDCKKATLDGNFLNLCAEYICEHLIPRMSLPRQPELVGGLTLGADFITAAICMYSSANGGSIRQGSIVRKEAKKHGTKSKVENEVMKGERDILVVDDVITSASSIARACDEFIAAGYKPVAMLTIIDRECGGREMLKEKYSKLGIDLWEIFRASEFTIN